MIGQKVVNPHLLWDISVCLSSYLYNIIWNLLWAKLYSKTSHHLYIVNISWCGGSYDSIYPDFAQSIGHIKESMEVFREKKSSKIGLLHLIFWWMSFKRGLVIHLTCFATWYRSQYLSAFFILNYCHNVKSFIDILELLSWFGTQNSKILTFPHQTFISVIKVVLPFTSSEIGKYLLYPFNSLFEDFKFTISQLIRDFEIQDILCKWLSFYRMKQLSS